MGFILLLFTRILHTWRLFTNYNSMHGREELQITRSQAISGNIYIFFLMTTMRRILFSMGSKGKISNTILYDYFKNGQYLIYHKL